MTLLEQVESMPATELLQWSYVPPPQERVAQDAVRTATRSLRKLAWDLYAFMEETGGFRVKVTVLKVVRVTVDVSDIVRALFARVFGEP